MRTSDEIIELAIQELRSRGEKFPIKTKSATYEKEHMSKGKGAEGWRVFVQFDIEVDPDHVFIEVYENPFEIVFQKMF